MKQKLEMWQLTETILSAEMEIQKLKLSSNKITNINQLKLNKKISHNKIIKT